MAENYTKDAYNLIYKHSSWKPKAKAFEHYLAVKLYNSAYTKDAVKTALGKISRILTGFYGDQGKTLNQNEEQVVENAAGMNDLAQQMNVSDQQIPINRTLVEALMQNQRDSSSAGQVMKYSTKDINEETNLNFTEEEAEEANLRTLDDIINGDGNLREQMALLYNGMFRNAGQKKKDIAESTSFKNILQNVTRENAANYASEDIRNMNFDLLEGQENYKKQEDIFDTRRLAIDMEHRDMKMANKGNFFTRWVARVKRHFEVKKLRNRTMRKTAYRKGEEGLGLDYYEHADGSIKLSRREKALGIQNGKLRWKEGIAAFKVKEESTAKGMLNIAGASGTALRMLGAYRIMGASEDELKDFRLALIAWMISSKDHSLYEILQGSHLAGVKGTEDLSEAANMYMNIDPLDTEILREEFTTDGDFPHEQVYKAMLEESKQQREENERQLQPELRGKRLLRAQYERDLEREKAEQTERTAEIARLKAALEKLKDTDSEEKNTIVNTIAELENLSRLSWDRMGELNKEIRHLPGKAEYVLFSTANRIDSLNAMAEKARYIALNIYTTEAYQTISVGQKRGMKAAMERLLKSTDNNKQYRSHYFGDKQNQKVIQGIFDLIRISGRMSQEALEEQISTFDENQYRQQAEAKYAGKLAELKAHMPEEEAERKLRTLSKNRYNLTFRGERSEGGKDYAVRGKELKINHLTSTSEEFLPASNFYAEVEQRVKNPDDAVLVIYELHSLLGGDITGSSNVRGEAEILLPVGTVLRVKTPLTKKVKAADLLNENYQTDPDSDTEKPRDLANRRYNIVVLEEVYNPVQRRRNQRLTEEKRQRLRTQIQR